MFVFSIIINIDYKKIKLSKKKFKLLRNIAYYNTKNTIFQVEFYNKNVKIIYHENVFWSEVALYKQIIYKKYSVVCM